MRLKLPLKRENLSREQRRAILDTLYPGEAEKRRAILENLYPGRGEKYEVLFKGLKSAEEVEKIRKEGRHRVGKRLYLNVDRRGNRSWIFRYMHDGKAREMGLGGYPAVSVEQAFHRVLCLRENFFDPLVHQRKLRKRADELSPEEGFRARSRGLTTSISRRPRPKDPEQEEKDKRLAKKRLMRICRREGIDPAELGIDPAELADI